MSKTENNKSQARPITDRLVAELEQEYPLPWDTEQQPEQQAADNTQADNTQAKQQRRGRTEILLEKLTAAAESYTDRDYAAAAKKIFGTGIESINEDENFYVFKQGYLREAHNFNQWALATNGNASLACYRRYCKNHGGGADAQTLEKLRTDHRIITNLNWVLINEYYKNAQPKKDKKK